MRLIDEAIDLLGDASQPLANAFFKAQVIAHKLKAEEFSNWVKNEIQGYGDNEVPDYRRVHLTPYGDVESMVRRYTNHKLPIEGMPAEIREKILVSYLGQSIAVIEEFARKGENLIVPLPAAAHVYLRKGIDLSYVITSAWGKPPAGCFTQISNEARSRLLALLLELSDVVPDVEDERDKVAMPESNEVNGMFKNAVFGDGANISLAIGHGSQASYNTTSVVKNDLESLIRELEKNKVSEKDIAELKTALKADSGQELGGEVMGAGVRSWLGSMISKAGTPAWEVPAQIGAGLLTSLISKFLGI
jgi:hypothetical protein